MSIFRALVRGLRWIHIISQISIVERSSNFRFFVTFPVCTPRAGFAQQKGNRKSSSLKTNLNLANLIALNLKTHCVQTAKIFNTSFALSIAKKYSWGAISIIGFIFWQGFQDIQTGRHLTLRNTVSTQSHPVAFHQARFFQLSNDER